MRRKLLIGALLSILLLALSFIRRPSFLWPSCDDPSAASPLLSSPFPPFSRPARSHPPSVAIVYVTAFPRHVAASIRSLCYWAAAHSPVALHVIVPDAMEAFFASSTPLFHCPNASAWGVAPVFKLTVWPESRLLPQLRPGAPWSGTTRQMALKLAAGSVVDSDYILVMDSDVYARRRFRLEDLFTPAGAARSNVDEMHYCQPASWYDHAGALLQSRIVADSNAYCEREGWRRGLGPPAPTCPAPHSAGGQWFAHTGSEEVPEEPFRLMSDEEGVQVVGACRHGRMHSIHVTPMLLSTDIIRRVLVPRLQALRGEGDAHWADVLFKYHAHTADACRGGLLSGRFYTWTEYSLYFVAAVASNAMSQYHAFREGGITSVAHSVMSPASYDAMDWDAIFSDEDDKAPFFVVHSWFGKPVEETNAHLAKHIPTLAHDVDDIMAAAPSAAPLYE